MKDNSFNSDDKIRVYIGLKTDDGYIYLEHDGLFVTIFHPSPHEYGIRASKLPRECSSAIIVNPRYGDRRGREIDLRPWNRAREISARTRLGFFSARFSIIIHPPSPPSARLNYPGLERGTKDGSRESRLLPPWKKKKQVVEGKPIGGREDRSRLDRL